jgi:hypothetical protein
MMIAFPQNEAKRSIMTSLGISVVKMKEELPFISDAEECIVFSRPQFHL